MSQKTDLQQATEQVNPSELADNLKADKVKKDTAVDQPQDLDNKEETPFIDESLRTDK